MARVDQIERELAEIDERLQEIAIDLADRRLPSDGDDILDTLLRKAFRRPDLEQERSTLLNKRRELEREYDRLPKHAKEKP
jgi:hypothetical protein